MNYWEGLSLLSFAFGSLSLIMGIFLSFYVIYDENSFFYGGFALLLVFWSIAIGVKSYSRVLKQEN